MSDLRPMTAWCSDGITVATFIPNQNMKNRVESKYQPLAIPRKPGPKRSVARIKRIGELHALGLSDTIIAEMLHCSKKTVSNTTGN